MAEVETKSWAELAKESKAPALREGQTVAFQRVQVLSQLGGEGWELVAVFEATGANAGREPPRRWTLKRRMP